MKLEIPLSDKMCDHIAGRAKAASSRFDLARSKFADGYRYCLPHMDDPFGVETESQQTGMEVYDDTAVQAAPELASKMLDMVWPLFSRGWRLEPIGALTDRTKRDQQTALDDATDKLHNMIESSNLRESVEQSFMDYLVTTAQTRIDVGSTTEPINGRSLNPWMSHIERHPNGEIIGYYRQRKLKAQFLESTYGPAAKIPDRLKSENEMDTDVSICEAVIRTDNLWTEAPQWLNAVLMKWDGGWHRIIEEQESGFGSGPMISFGWARRNNNWWHYGPVQTVMPSVITLNTIVEFVLEHADMAVGGIWKMPVMNGVNTDNIVLQSGTIIPYRGDTRGLEAVGFGGNMQVAEVLEMKLAERVKRGLMDEDFRGRGDTPVSSREIAARQSMTAQRSSSPFARLVREFLIPFVMRAGFIARKMGLMELPDQFMLGSAVEPISPAARQYRMEAVSQTIDFIGAINQTFGPTVSNMWVQQEEVLKDWAWAYEQPGRYVRNETQMRSAVEKFQTLGPMMQGMAPPDSSPSNMPTEVLQ